MLLQCTVMEFMTAYVTSHVKSLLLRFRCQNNSWNSNSFRTHCLSFSLRSNYIITSYQPVENQREVCPSEQSRENYIAFLTFSIQISYVFNTVTNKKTYNGYYFRDKKYPKYYKVGRP